MGGRDKAERVKLMAPRRRAVSLGILLALLILLPAFAPDVLLVIFAGLLFAVFFSGGGERLARRLGIGRNWGIGLFLLILVLAQAGISLAFAPFAVVQFEQLSRKVPEAFESVRERLKQYSWREKLLERATPGALMSEG